MQEVNLYQPVSKGVRGALSATSTRHMLLVIAVTLAGMWAFAAWQVERLNNATLVVRNQQQAQAAMSAAQGPELENLTDEELASLVSRLAANVDVKSRALAMLGGDGARGAGFAARLRAIAERHIDGIWLEQLALGVSSESISLSGSTLSPDAVPRYLRSLAQDPVLRGGKIDEFVIEKPATRKAAQAGTLSFRAGPRMLTDPNAALGLDEEG